MTITQKKALKSKRIEELGARIKAILQHERRPLDLPTIEFYLQADQVKSEGRVGDLDTFAVRDAVSKLVAGNEAAFTAEDEVYLP